MKDLQELRIFIKKKLKSGYPVGELKNELLEHGYPLEMIDKAIYEAPALHEKLKKQQPVTINNSVWYMICIGFIITGVAITSVSFLRWDAIGYALIIIGGIGFFTKLFLSLIKSEDERA